MAQSPTDDLRPIAEISQGPSAFEAFLDRNVKTLVITGSLLILGAGGWIIHKSMKESEATKASIALGNASESAQLEAVIKDFPDTPSALSAELLLSNQQWDKGQQEASIETLRKITQHGDSHPATISARAFLGSRLFAQGKYGDASSAFQDLLNTPGSEYLASYALTRLGDIAKNEGKIDEAKKFYQQAIDRPGTDGVLVGFEFANAAKQNLLYADFVMPTEVEPPPAPAADPNLPQDPSPGIPSIPAIPGIPSDGTPNNPLFDTPPAIPEEPADPAPAEPQTPPAPPETPAEPETPPADDQ